MVIKQSQEQAKVLRDEIRRLERNQEREKESATLEYLKKKPHIARFMKCCSNEREHRDLVLEPSTMAKLS
ncbi:RANBP2-like and GRIP domain-containing protein 8 [Acropora cervicornis]|uniref:RANBP2-like and GRIP domain-containing protein 8 n=1 Tax=Acropora cervicornis TaxID=6130 RepID=A0AAD9R674_ACRCE|nr:RANBP2-like and GRIP domain-containing protein 8 [Acropora cervicornis]KAK2573774.1 RANBP2-like and GRIP domain-containing protein 8 [Acropora cervicornis]